MKYLTSFTLYNNCNSSVGKNKTSKNKNYYNFLNIANKSLIQLNENKSLNKIDKKSKEKFKRTSDFWLTNENIQPINQNNSYILKFNNEKNGCYANVSVQMILSCECLLEEVLIYFITEINTIKSLNKFFKLNHVSNHNENQQINEIVNELLAYNYLKNSQQTEIYSTYGLRQLMDRGKKLIYY